MTEKKPQNPGHCLLCDQVIGSRSATQHLKPCVAKHSGGDGSPAKHFHLVVTATYAPEFWMHLEIPAAETLDLLDDFLRKIWLECCGHLSGFQINGTEYCASSPFGDGMFGAREMHERLFRVLDVGSKFSYIYDYGSSTKLSLRVVDCRRRPTPPKGIRLLARNDMLELACAECGKPATQIRVGGFTWSDRDLFCEQCFPEEEEEYALPVVNSPRMGVCGYTG